MKLKVPEKYFPLVTLTGVLRIKEYKISRSTQELQDLEIDSKQNSNKRISLFWSQFRL